MDKSISSWKKHLTYLLCGLINIQPVLANVVVGGTNTTTTVAGNGVEVVNIAAPNSKGLSHNQYQQFNVDKSGLILNNSTAQLSQSQLGGLLQNNPNLTGQAASVILNEVTGANRSQLQGYTEVFGASANVILANPYGITCDGCGFINTPRVTLSTGTPEFTNGEVSGFDVSQGSVTVEGLGLDASNQTYFDIISRTAEINAEIHAQNLTIVTGQNTVDYQTNKVTKKASDNVSKPALSIDSSSLGGMYAGRIALIATEAGVGVNVGNLAASQEGIHITADGKVVMGNTSSAQSLTVSTSDHIEMSGNHSTGKQMSLTGKRIVASNSTLVAGSEMALTAGSVELIHSNAEAAQFTAQADKVSIDETSRVTSQSASLTQLGTLDNQGAVSVSNEMKVEGDALSLTGAGNLKAATLTVDAQALSFETNAGVQDATLTARHALALTAGSQLSASNDVSLSGENITQSGTLTANQTIALNASKTLTHNGTTQGKDVSIAAQTLNQTGQLTGNQSVVINSDAVLLGGDTNAGQCLVANTDTLTVNGKVQSAGTVTLSSDTSLNTMVGSALLSGGDMQLEVPSVELAGTTQSAGSLIIDAQSSVLGGAVSAQQSVVISGKTVTQSGTLAAGESLSLTQTESITLDGTVEAATDITATTQDFSSSLTLVSGGDISVTVNDTTIEGVSSSGGDLTITSATLNQSGETLAQGDMTLITDNSALTGSVESKQALAITANNGLTTTSGTKLTSGDAITINAGTFTHQGHLTSQGNTQLTTQSLTNQGELTSNQNLSLATNTLNHQGKLSANGDMALTVNGALVMSENVSSGGDLSVTAHSLNNRAEINSAKQTKVTLTGGLTNQSSGVISGDTTQITANSISNSGTLQAMNALTLATSSLTNPGALIALGDLIATVSGTITNTGLVYAGNNANLYVNVLKNYSDILSQKNITIARNATKQKSSSLLNSSATIESLGGGISIYADTVTNKRTTLNIQSTLTNYNLSSKPGAGGSSFEVDGHSLYAPEYTARSYCSDNCGGKSDQGAEKFTTEYKVIGGDSHSFLAKNESQTLTSASAASRIMGQNQVEIEAQNVSNDASQIHGSTVKVTSTNLSNKAYLLSEHNVFYDYKLDANYYGLRRDSGRTIKFLFHRTIRKVNPTTTSTIGSSITATGNVSLNVANKVNNSTIKSNASRVSPSGSSKSAKSTHSANVTGPNAVRLVGVSSITSPSITLPNFNDVPFPDFRLPSSPNGLFIYSKGPASGYLIETNPLLTNLGNYLGSDYFLGNVGFHPEKDITFLGDAFYDTRVVTQAIFEQTGKRYLNESVGNDFGQMQQLMDAAASQKSGLNLELGIALSPEQVANLSQDILWYEQIEVNGQTVLAPKLYLAQLTRDNISNGAVIAGRDIDIKAGEINNSGAMLADNTLSLKSDSSISNDTGTLSGGGDVALLAKGDIENVSGTIEGDNVNIASVEGSVTNKTLRQTNQYDADFITTDIGQTAKITSSGNLAINAGNDILNEGGELKAKGDAHLTAGQDIRFTTIEDKAHKRIVGNRRVEETREVNHLGSTVRAGGAMSLNAGESVAMTSATVEAQGDLALSAGESVTIDTARNESYRKSTASNRTEIHQVLTHDGSRLSGRNITIGSGKNVSLIGSDVTAKQNVGIIAKGDVSILAVNDSEYRYSKEKQKKSFGRSKTIIHESLNETVKGSAITAGEDISITAQALGAIQTAGGDSDIQVVGSSLNADGNVALNADGDIVLAAQQYKEYERNQTIKKGFGGLSSQDKGSIDDATLLNSSYALSGRDININAGRDIAALASEVVADGDVNLTAIDEVLISAGEVLKQSQEWNEKTSFLSGGNLFEMESQREGLETKTAQSSVVQSGGDLTVDAGNIKVVGSDIVSGKSVSLTADTGDVEIFAAKETSQFYSEDKKLAISLGGLSKMLSGEMVEVEDGKIKINLGDATYDKVDEQSDSVNHKGSVIQAGDHIAIASESDIVIEGSQLIADDNGSETGDISLIAKDDVIIQEAKNSLNTQKDEIHGKAEASIVVQHQAVELAKAAMAAKEATKKLKQAKKDYKQYKKQMDALEGTLSTLEQEYAQKKPGVLYEDIEELSDLLSEVKSDEAWYVTGIVLAAADVTSKTTLLVQQGIAAAQSTGTYGFNAGIQLDVEVSKTGTTDQQTSSLASTLSGENIRIQAGNQEGDQAKIQGATLLATDALSISANEVNLLASTDTQSQKSKNESGSISASMTVYGASSGINLNASLSRNESKSASTTHQNSTLSAEDISITSAQDTNIKGANVDAKEHLNVAVGGNLNIASVQDRHSASNKGMGISAGLSFSGGEVPKDKAGKEGGFIDNTGDEAGKLTGASGGTNVSNGRSRSKQTILTTLTSGNTATITVANNTDVKGALIATKDEQGNDLGNLNLQTDTFTYADLSNTQYNQSQNMGISTSVGLNGGEIDATNNSTNLQYKNESGYSKSKTLATVGQGTVTIMDSENSHDTTALNRDTLNTEKDLFTVDRKQGDFDVTVDHRLLSEDGRKDIKEDFKRTELAGQSLADVATEDSVTLADTFEHMDVVQKELDVQLLIAQSKGESALNINNLDNATAKQKQDAINDYANAYSEVFGISIESALVIAVNKSISGAHYTGDKGSNIVLNDTSMKNAQDYMNTLAHEVTHGLEKQGIIGDKGKQSENYANLFGNYAEGNYEFALNHSGLGDVKQGNTNSYIGNDSALVTGNSDGFTKKEKDLKPGEIDYMNIPHIENLAASGIKEEALKEYNNVDGIINDNAKSKEAVVNYFSIALGGVRCVGGNVAGCAGAGIATSDLGEVLTKGLESNNVANDPIQKAMMDLVPDYIDNDSKKAVTDLLLGGYGVKDIHKIPQAKKKIDAIVNSLNKASELGSAEVYLETMYKNINEIWNGEDINE